MQKLKKGGSNTTHKERTRLLVDSLLILDVKNLNKNKKRFSRRRPLVLNQTFKLAPFIADPTSRVGSRG